jgi:general secretion pathway protein I
MRTIRDLKLSILTSGALRSIKRRGLTLFEVVLALAIFLAALAALSQLTTNGVRAAMRARLQTQAIIRCESKLAEVIAGVEAFDPVASQRFVDDPRWIWSLSITPTEHPDLIDLEVTVAYTASDIPATSSYSLIRRVRDPQLFRDAELREMVEEQP